MVVGLGCGGVTLTKRIGPNDLPSLAGKWDGTVILPTGRGVPGALDLSPSGDYSVVAGDFIARGTAQVTDGALTLVPTTTYGAGAAVGDSRSSVATLSQRPDGSLVLTGSGHSGIGPFGYELMRRK
jgi:hypothetical protein